MHSRFLVFTALGLALFLSAPTQAADSDPVLQRWSATILNTLPERQQGQALLIQEKSARRASHAWLGMSSLNLEQEKTRTSADFPVENNTVSIDFPLKIFHQKKVFDQLTQAYQKQVSTHLPYRQWQARGIARALMNQIENKQIHTQAAKRRLQQAEQLHRLVQAQVQAGESSALDAALAAQRLSQSQAQWQAAWQALLAQWQQAATWGIQPPEGEQALLQPLSPLTSKTAEVPEQPHIRDNWLSHHPLLLWLQTQTQTDVNEARSDWWESRNSTSIGLGAIRESAFDTPEYTLMTISVSVPLGRSPGEHVAKARWQAAENNQTITVQRTRLNLKQQWQQARADWEKARQLLQPANTQWQAAKKALALTEQSWQQGESSLRDLLLAQQAALEARLEADLAWQRLAAASRNLKQASGE